MKNKVLKQFIGGIMIGLMAVWCFVAPAASVTKTFNGAQTNSLVSSNAGNITQISLTATGTAFSVSFYDAPALSLTNITAGWTNYTPTIYTNGVGPITNSYVDILGATNVIAYQYLTNLPTVMTNITTTAYSNFYRLIGTYSAPANTTVTIPYTTANPFVFGLFSTNSPGGSVVVTYQPYR